MSSPIVWIETQYLTDTYCSSAPNSMRVFFTADPMATSIPSNETWPTLFSWNSAYPYRPCGNLQSQLASTQVCCAAAYDLSVNGTAGVSSGADYVIPAFNGLDTTIFPYLYKNANGKSYCSLNASDSVSLSGFQAILYLNDGNCNDAYNTPIRCFPNNTVVIYSGLNCTSDSEMYSLSSTAQDISTMYLGNITGAIYTIKGGQRTTGWVSNIAAGAAFVVPIKNAIEIMGFGCFIIALLLHSAALFWAIWTNLKAASRRKRQRMFLLMSQILWLLKVMTAMVSLISLNILDK